MTKTYQLIWLDYQRSVKQAATLEQVVGELAICGQNLEEQRSEIGNKWTGENAAAYLRKLKETSDDVKRISKNIQNTVDVIRRMAKRTYDTEMESLRIAQSRTYR